MIELTTNGEWDYIASNTYYAGKSITLNGRHVAVKVGNIVFDNLHKFGIPYSQWLKDFVSPAKLTINILKEF